MKREHTEQVMQALETAYPQFYRGKDGDERRAALRLWHKLFEDDDGMEVAAAVKAFIATDVKGFPPGIGQIKERLTRLRAPDIPDEAQAWELVSRAIRRGAYHAADAFAALPPVVRQAVGSPSMLRTWARTSRDELETVVASNFQRAYRARARDAMERIALPADIRRLLERSDPTEALPEPPNPEEQKQNALRLLAESREAETRRILGDAYDEISDPRDERGAAPPRRDGEPDGAPHG